MSLFSINAMLILTTDDRTRLLTKYYSAPHPPAHVAPGSSYPGASPYPTLKDQKAFEKGLMEKTNKQTSDVILYDNRVVVFKMEGDVMLYVVGGAEENEVLLFSVVLALRDSLSILLKYIPILFSPYDPLVPTRPKPCKSLLAPYRPDRRKAPWFNNRSLSLPYIETPQTNAP